MCDGAGAASVSAGTERRPARAANLSAGAANLSAGADAGPPALLRAIAGAGFEAEAVGGRLWLRPSAAWMVAFERERPAEGFFSATMLRFRGAPPSPDAVALFADGVRWLESGDANERRAFVVRARQYAAVALRTGCGGGYAVALLADALERLLRR